MELHFQSKKSLFVPDPVRPRETWEVVKYRKPDLSEFVEGFEFEYLRLGDVFDDSDDKWLPYTVTEGFRLDEVAVRLRAGLIRTKSPKKAEDSPIAVPLPRKENYPQKDQIINQSDCPECKSLVFYTTEPHCAICEARQLRQQ